MEPLEGGHRSGRSTDGNRSGLYYNHKVLLGITREERIDSARPNVYFHGSSKCRDGYHPLRRKILALIRHQLGKDLNYNGQHLGIQGAGGSIIQG